MLNRNLERIIAASYIKLGDNALRLARNHKNGLEGSKRQEAIWNKSASVRILLKGLESRVRQEDTRVNKLLSCLVKLSDINDYPAAPLLFNNIKPSVVLPQGIQGDPGTPGTAGSDADIVVQEGDDTIEIVETNPGGVKTYTVSYNPYTQPSISTTVNTGAITAPASRYREIGESISVPLSIVVTKGRENVTASTVTAPAALDTAYQSALNLTTINTVGNQTIPLTDIAVTASETYSVNVTDGTNTPADSDNIYFNYPILVGSNAAASINHYAVLTKKTRTDGGIQPQQTTTVTFSGTNQYFFFAFDEDYPALTSIKDQNGFEVINSFTYTTGVSVDSTGLAANWTRDFREYRTTNPTTINGTYTFTW